MFEGKPPLAHFMLPSAAGNFADELLTEFSWSDLIAQLCATQELRTALAHVPATARASFDAMTAEHLTNRRAFVLHERKPSVNLAPSVNGKGEGATDGASATSAAQLALRGIA